jgi:hypothetical protein
MTLTIIHPTTQARSTYSQQNLIREAREAVKDAPLSNGRLTAWRIVTKGAAVTLEADYQTWKGEPRTRHIALTVEADGPAWQHEIDTAAL